MSSNVKKQPTKAQRKRNQAVKKAAMDDDWTQIPTTRSKWPKPKKQTPTQAKRGQLERSYGEQLGGLLGKGAQTLATRIFGSGDYAVKSNTLLGGNVPQFERTGNKAGVKVRHREYLQDIIAGTAFTLTTFNLNPGLVGSFPWVSQVAQAFEEYIIHGLVVEFVSESSDAVLSTGTNSALGVVMMAITYDALDPVFPDKKTMLNYEFAQSRKPSESFMLPMECSRAETPFHELFVRTGAQPANSDIRLYDAGVLQVAVQGQQAASGTLGELWMTYDIEFLKPKTITEQGDQLLTDHYAVLSGPTNSAVLTGMARTTQSTLGSTLSGSTITFPSLISAGTFMVFAQWTAAGATALTNQVTLTPTNGNISPNLFKGNSVAMLDNHATTSAQYFMLAMVTVTSLGASIAFGVGGTLPTTVTSADVIITQINGGLNFKQMDSVNKLLKGNPPDSWEDCYEEPDWPCFYQGFSTDHTYERCKAECGSLRYKNWRLTSKEYQELQSFRENEKETLAELQSYRSRELERTESEKHLLAQIRQRTEDASKRPPFIRQPSNNGTPPMSGL